MSLMTAMRWAALAGAVAAPITVALGDRSAVRTVAVLLLFGLAPGAALTARAARAGAPPEAGLVLALSVAVVVVVAQLLLLLDAWDLELAVYGLAAPCVPALALALVRPRLRSVR